MKKKISLIILFLITVFGFILRYINLTAYNIYSDSYEFMLVAKKLIENFSLDGILGKNGMYWSPLFYNRIGFGFFLSPFYWLINNLELSAHLLLFSAGILAIPLIYVLATNIFKQREIGLIAALLLAISFGNVMLSGFIMANSLVVLLIILSLIFLFKAQKNHKLLWYLFSGAILAITFFLRNELLITLPAFIVLILFKEKFTQKILVFLSSFSITFGLLILKTYLFLSNKQLWWYSQYIYISRFISYFGLIILVFFLFLGFLIFLLKKKEDYFLSRLPKIYSIWVIVFLLICFFAPFIAGKVYNWAVSWFSLRTDFLMIIFGFIGLIFLFKKDFYKGIFFYLFIFPLLLIYFVFGGGADFRHLNILSPLFIILAAFCIWRFLLILKNWLSQKEGLNYKLSLWSILLIIGLLFYLQFYQNLRPWHSIISYEKEVGQSLAKIIQQENIPKDTIILSAFPEAHYIYTEFSTWEQKKEKPFIDPSIPDNQRIILVVDESTRDNYPKLAETANRYLKPYSLKSILSTVKYQYGNHIWFPRDFTRLYYLTAGDFRKAVEK